MKKTFYRFCLEKYGITKGCSYVEPEISITKAALFASEYYNQPDNTQQTLDAIANEFIKRRGCNSAESGLIDSFLEYASQQQKA
jgi:hypothetical protein